MSSFAGHYGNPGPKHTPNATAETNPSTIASRMTARASNLSSKFNPAIAFAVLSWPTLSRGLRDELTGELRETRKWLYTSLGHDESKTIPPQFVNPATAYSLDAPSRLSPNEDWSGRAHSNLTDVTVELRPYFDAMTTHNNKIGRTYLTHLQSFSDMDPTGVAQHRQTDDGPQRDSAKGIAGLGGEGGFGAGSWEKAGRHRTCAGTVIMGCV